VTIEKARLIVKTLDHGKALIFLDTFTDSLDGLLFLANYPNILLVCSDRDYNFGIISHQLSREQFRIIDVTELSPADIQSCLQPIPTNIRTPNIKTPKISSGLQPSLFEIIETNIEKPTLKKRFASVLSDLGKKNPQLRDLLVMISYVYAARVPVSMDMMVAYLRDITSDYNEIYAMRDYLGNLVSDYYDPVFGEEQDYFVPRSILVSEAVLDEVDGEVLKRMLVRFHNNISPYRITRFDIFRRHGFDASIMEKAFRDADEGKQFYEELYYRDQSPYLLQHAAIYLSRKRRHTEAFEMIDKALTVSGGRIWSIRNSHAIILFKANIGHFDKPNARNTLRESMKILTECYKWDKRKPFHAITFSDQAIQYWKAYRDEEALQYLRTARKWLDEEFRIAPWNRSLKRLLETITKNLRKITTETKEVNHDQ
jgi:tetratricopeptide (TPR) repeat protein